MDAVNAIANVTKLISFWILLDNIENNMRYDLKLFIIQYLGDKIKKCHYIR